MERIILFFSLTLLLNGNALANVPFPASRYISYVPIEEAHSYSGYASERALKAESIKALIWNIKKGELEQWDEEFTSYGKDQDVYLIQEAFENDHFTSTLKTFPHVRWDMGISFFYKIYNAATGSMVGSDVEPSEVIVKQSPDFEPVLKTPKSMTMAKYPIEGQDLPLLVISVHGINFTGLECFRDHMNQAWEIIEKHEGPILFAGDFNTHSKARTRYLMNQINKYGLRAVEFKNGHQRMSFAGNYLDHGFVRGLKVNHAEVYGESKGSDHRPMVMELALDLQ
jgi:endonuclease/exonuclease/phosphatase (EEP) superfamily protein YafD